ncbi:MAG: DUF4942 domain-containing protein [Alphaproteobacteria bacterium]|nr:DUF4942 domain-containing protein [Alphaproteobacteria bacterium]
MTSTDLSFGKRLSDILEEYNTKLENIPQELEKYKKAGDDLEKAATISGTYGNTIINIGKPWINTLKSSLLKSAWRHVYDGLNIKRLATAKDKKLFEQSMENPPEFTIDNIRATFGNYIEDPRSNILRGLAEVFSELDPHYKSHDKVKIGVKGLPKRVIITGFNDFSYYGKNKLESVLNALASYQGLPLISHTELNAILKDGNILRYDSIIGTYNTTTFQTEPKNYPARGIWLKRFANGNGHLFFDETTLKDINMALAEYYGDVIADCYTEEFDESKSTAVSKDLQYYPTPFKIVDIILNNYCYIKPGDFVLEPSCGDGRFLDGIRARNGNVLGIEYDKGRVEVCRLKGHNILHANFLETLPEEKYDKVVMNPPFYGKHYAKHVEHAFKFLKQGGTLVAILPITARYDHGLLTGQWNDLPVGSFTESGTNINTTILTMYKR